MGTHVTTARPSFGLSARRLRAVRTLATMGLLLCSYLFVQSLRDSGPAGCNPVAGCGQVLAGRGSAWFGLPVSLPAGAVYLAILISARFVQSEDRTWWLRSAGRFLAATTALAAGGGTWFLAIQLAAGHVVCIYCAAVNACGLLAAGLVWQCLPHWRRRLLTPAGAGLAILVLGQAVVFRHPYNVQADIVGTATKPGATADHHVRIVAGGRLFDLDPAKLPLIGSPSSSHFIVILSDYTCEHCRMTHRMLDRSERASGNQVSVIVLPVLLDPAANPYLPPGATHPLPQDIALTRIALAVYCARPAAFADMNRWLFAEDRVREEAEARAYAGQLVGAEALRSAEGDPRISQLILTGCELFARSGSGSIPKLLIGATQITGAIDDVEALRKVVAREWGIEIPD